MERLGLVSRAWDRPDGAAAVSVLGRATLLLGAFDAHSPVLSLAELTRRVGLPKPTVWRLARELVELRLLAVDGDGAGYRLGLRLFELGELALLSRGLGETARPYLEDLRQATGQRVHLAVLDGVDVVYLLILGAGPGRIASRTGGRLPAHATGVGKALLAFSAPAVVRARIEAGLPPSTPRTIVTPGALARELTGIRASGLAMDREESHVGLSCVAAPVFDTEGVVAAVSVTGPTARIDVERLGPAVRTTALALGRRLGVR